MKRTTIIAAALLALSSLARAQPVPPTYPSQPANTVVANTTSSTARPIPKTLPSCTDGSGRHLNYTQGTGFSCGTSTGPAVPGGSSGQLQYNNAGALGGGNWSFSSNNLIAGTDNSYNIGASGANRPANIYAGTRLFSPGLTTSATSALTMSANNSVFTANGANMMQFYSPDGVNQYFGSTQNFSTVSSDGIRLGDFIWDGDNHYLTTRGYLGWKDDNPMNIGRYRVNYSAGNIVSVKKYDSIAIDWAIGSRDGRITPSAGGYGRAAQWGVVANEEQTSSNSGGTFYISATQTGGGAQPTAFWVSGTSQATVMAGKAWATVTNVVDFPGYGVASIYMPNAATQTAMSFRDVTTPTRGFDYGWQTSNNRFYGYSVTGGALATMFSYDPANGNQYHGSNENLLVLDNANSRVYVNDTATISGSTSKLQATQAGGAPLSLRRTTDDGNIQLLYSPSGLAGYIAVSGTTATYNSISDQRKKANIHDMNYSASLIDRIQPRAWNWKADGKTGVGFVAQELVQVVPEAVSVGDSVATDDSDPNFKAWAVDASKLMPYVIQELQSLRKRVADLEAANDNLQQQVKAITK